MSERQLSDNALLGLVDRPQLAFLQPVVAIFKTASRFANAVAELVATIIKLLTAAVTIFALAAQLLGNFTGPKGDDWASTTKDYITLCIAKLEPMIKFLLALPNEELVTVDRAHPEKPADSIAPNAVREALDVQPSRTPPRAGLQNLFQSPEMMIQSPFGTPKPDPNHPPTTLNQPSVFAAVAPPAVQLAAVFYTYYEQTKKVDELSPASQWRIDGHVPAFQAVKAGDILLSASEVNLRNGPGASSAASRTLPGNACVRVIERAQALDPKQLGDAQSGGWLKVTPVECGSLPGR